MHSGRIWLKESSPDLPYVVLLPGWAHDWRTMRLCRANINRIYVSECISHLWKSALADFLTQSCVGTVSIIGWSMGGFAAVDFARAYPEMVDKLLLVGIRSEYSAEEIQLTKDELASDPMQCLENFFRRNFLPAQRADWAAFRNELMGAYLADLDTNELMNGLDYLATSKIHTHSLGICPTVLVHGGRDVVAPVEAARELAQSSGAVIEVIEKASHAAFLHEDFSGIVEKWLK